MAACLLNIGLNMILIPKFGIVGAAQATLISYIFHTVVITYYAFKEFSFRIDYAHAFLYLAAAVAMYLLIIPIDGGSSFVNLLIKIPAGAVSYVLLILAFDKTVRTAVGGMATRFNVRKLSDLFSNKSKF